MLVLNARFALLVAFPSPTPGACLVSFLIYLCIFLLLGGHIMACLYDDESGNGRAASSRRGMCFFL
jgi:hypothetical protein